MILWGLDTTNSPVVGGTPGYGFHPSQSQPGMTTLPVPESAVPDNGKVGNQVLCPHSQCFRSHFDVICLMYVVSSGILAFLSSQPHPRQSSSSTQFSQECVCRKVIVKITINPNKDDLDKFGYIFKKQFWRNKALDHDDWWSSALPLDQENLHT